VFVLAALGGQLAAREDSTAKAPTAPAALAAPGSVFASKGGSSDRVQVRWSAVSSSVGTSHVYAVAAKAGAVVSARSSSNTGYRAVTLTAYEVWRSGGDGGVDVGAGGVPYDDAGRVSYDDFLAPPGSIADAGIVVASEGTYTTHVALSLTGVSTTPGAAVAYQVQTKSALGVGAWSEMDTGYRGVGLGYRWQMLRDEFDPFPSDRGRVAHVASRRRRSPGYRA
jgi:hypothetical protein